jgi:predicted Rossmann fold nucleotide-binding protein DprA/Smf involved in DNA uptake
LRKKTKATDNTLQTGVLPIKKLIDKVVSGGQTGVDRAALDVAIELGIPHGGWCPRGRLSEDGIIPSHYELVEMESDLYADRTRQNVIDSDGTLVLYHDRLEGGTLLTCKFAEQTGKLCMKLRLARSSQSSARKLLTSKAKVVRTWLDDNQIRTLNIAGPRGSKYPDIYARAREFLRLIFSESPKIPLD